MVYTAIIVEPRKHKALKFVLQNFLENLSNDWNIIIFHGNLNIEYVNNIVQTDLLEYKDRVSLVNLNIDNLTRDEYSSMFITNRHFYDHIPTETFLVFQTDAIIFSKHKHLINDFLQYDYVGAPWNHMPKNGQTVGNGGLSLRKKSKMLEIMEKDDYTYLAEDVFFACTDKVDLYKPSHDDAKRFSIENIPSDIAFGGHQSWLAAYYHRNFPLYDYYPEILTLYSLQYCE